MYSIGTRPSGHSAAWMCASFPPVQLSCYYTVTVMTDAGEENMFLCLSAALTLSLQLCDKCLLSLSEGRSNYLLFEAPVESVLSTVMGLFTFNISHQNLACLIPKHLIMLAKPFWIVFGSRIVYIILRSSSSTLSFTHYYPLWFVTTVNDHYGGNVCLWIARAPSGKYRHKQQRTLLI